MPKIKKLYSFMKPYRKAFFLAVIAMMSSSIALGMLPNVEGMITSQIYSDIMNQQAIQMNLVLRTMCIMIGLYLVKTIGQALCAIYLTKSIQNAMRDLRNALQAKLNTLPLNYFDTRKQGDILSVITNDVDAISNALQQVFQQVLSGIISISIAIFMMFYLNWKMACIAMLIIPGMALITLTIVKKSQQQFEKQQAALGDLNGAINELYNGHYEIMLYNGQSDAIDKFATINANLQASAQKAQFASLCINPLNSLVTYLIITTIAVVGSIFSIDGLFDPGKLQAFIRYIWQLNDPLSQVSSLSNQIQSAYASLERVVTLLDEKEMQQDELVDYDVDKLKAKVTFEHVTFGYNEKIVIKDFNMEVNEGEMIAIVGPTGAGKSTMINLLMRFYELNSGSIKIDGIDISKMKRQDLRSLFAMVLQDTWLFKGSIYDNVRYGNLDARKDEVIEACKQANVHHFVRTLSHGYDTVLNEETSNISLGEKQLLTIARAFLKNPKILILDEATSSVDTRIEKMLQEAMSKVVENRTSFVIAHRLSTIRSADKIIVMNEGEIVEYGSHEQLMANKGFYYQLYQSQFEQGGESDE